MLTVQNSAAVATSDRFPAVWPRDCVAGRQRLRHALGSRRGVVTGALVYSDRLAVRRVVFSLQTSGLQRLRNLVAGCLKVWSSYC